MPNSPPLPFPPLARLPCVGDFVQWVVSNKSRFNEPRRVQGVTRDNEWVYIEGVPDPKPMGQVIVVHQSVGPPLQTAPPPNPYYRPGGSNALDNLPLAKSEAVEARFTLDEGQVVIRWPGELSADSVRDLEHFLEGLLRRARRKAGIGGGDSSASM